MYRSFKEAAQGGPTYVKREMETGFAMKAAGVTWEQWEYPDNQPCWLHDGDFREMVRGHDLIIGPAFEDGGHEQHNALATILNQFHPDIRYLSYVRGFGRSEGVEVVPTAEEWALKQRALACYESQAAYPPTATWFDLADQREFCL